MGTEVNSAALLKDKTTMFVISFTTLLKIPRGNYAIKTTDE